MKLLAVKNRVTADSFDQVHWEAIDIAMHSIPKSRDVFLSKNIKVYVELENLREDRRIIIT
jgi:hypothetical protein